MSHTKKDFIKLPKHKLEEIVNGLVEVELVEPFQVIRETLTRLGVLRKGVLYETCHILFKKNKYYIVHFKQLFALDGRESSMLEDDQNRIYKIVDLLLKWGMIRILDSELSSKLEKNKDVYVDVVRLIDVRDGNIILKKKYNL